MNNVKAGPFLKLPSVPSWVSMVRVNSVLPKGKGASYQPRNLTLVTKIFGLDIVWMFGMLDCRLLAAQHGAGNWAPSSETPGRSYNSLILFSLLRCCSLIPCSSCVMWRHQASIRSLITCRCGNRNIDKTTLRKVIVFSSVKVHSAGTLSAEIAWGHMYVSFILGVGRHVADMKTWHKSADSVTMSP